MKRPHLVNMMKKWLDFLLEILAFLFFVLALWLVYNEIQKIGWAQLLSLISQTPFSILLVALFFTLCDYMAFSGYDFLALKYIGKKLPKAKVIEAAMASFSVTNTTGHAYIAGGSLRYMLYSKQGLSEINVLKMIAFESVTYLLGMACVFDLALILSSFFHQSHNNLYIHWFYTGAILVSILVFLYWIYFIYPKRKISFRKIQIKAPSARMTLEQMIIGSLDIIASSLVFYTLLSYHIDVNIIHVLTIFILAQLIGISTQVPGGLGVFEGAFLYLFVHTPEEKGGILAALITFRILYYFVPLFLTGLFFLGSQTRNFIKRKK